MSPFNSLTTRTRRGGLARLVSIVGSVALSAGLLAAPAAHAESPGSGTSTESPGPEPSSTTEPTQEPTQEPSGLPSVHPTDLPSGEPSATAEPTQEPTQQPTAAPAPVNTAPPVVDGEAVVGGTLSSTGGGWEAASRLRFVWTVDGTAVQTSDHVVGESDSLLLSPGMAGKTVQLTVTASGDEQSPSTEAAATPVVVRSAEFTGLVWSNALTGRAVVGQSLSLARPAWDDSASHGTLSYQWYRGMEQIPGATTERYLVGAADVSRPLWAAITLSAPGFTDHEFRSAQLTAASAAFTSVAIPTIGGTARVGQVQTANPGASAPAAGSFSYQWYRGTAVIPGAVGRSYTTTAADNGKTLKVRVRSSKPGYTSVDRFSAARTIAVGLLVATKSPAVTGTHRYGNTLKVSQAWPAGTTVRYQWYRNGAAVKGATGNALFLNPAYIGTRLNVKVAVSKPGYLTRSVTTTPVGVGRGLITLKTAPHVTGRLALGSVLTAYTGSYTPVPTSFAYQWYRNGAAIPGARARSYRVAAADNGRSLSVRVVATRGYYESRATTSAAVKLPLWPVTVLRGDGVYRVGTQIKPGLYKATGSGVGCYWARLSGFGGRVADIKANYYGSARTYVQINAGDVGFQSYGCGSWTTVTPSGPKATQITTDGIYRVGIDILPGTYYGSSSHDGCYLAALTGFSGTMDDIAQNYYGHADVIATVPSWITALEVRNCGILTRY
ncbi:hypothetical protein [Arthrobacter sp. NPDC090010]|uniref:hypothetical protein n=1 Tax=Arthrobacter sp. NPDC090010 TaxID=3363942 RepID=UPI00380247DB